MTQTQHFVPSPLSAPPGMSAKDQEELLKAQFPTMVKGATAEVTQELADTYRYIVQALGYWEEQKKLITNQLRLVAGTAQTVTHDGVPIARRRQFHVDEKVVPEYDVDAFYVAGRKRG